ncbi:MAG TPA: hypothetical protein VKP11_00170 [Frankiaceae bacterium]|nr:hypothetical protein [Frankiaceae bacterium]
MPTVTWPGEGIVTSVDEAVAAADFETTMRELAALDHGRFSRMLAVVEALLEGLITENEVIAYQAVGDVEGLEALVVARRLPTRTR